MKMKLWDVVAICTFFIAFLAFNERAKAATFYLPSDDGIYFITGEIPINNFAVASLVSPSGPVYNCAKFDCPPSSDNDWFASVGLTFTNANGDVGFTKELGDNYTDARDWAETYTIFLVSDLYRYFSITTSISVSGVFSLSDIHPMLEIDLPNGMSVVRATPLPATLPLFASGLGVMGLFGWRRKRKASAEKEATLASRTMLACC